MCADITVRVEFKAPLFVCSTSVQLFDETCANLPRVDGCHGGYSHGAGSSGDLQSTEPLTLVHTHRSYTQTYTLQSVSVSPLHFLLPPHLGRLVESMSLCH